MRPSNSPYHRGNDAVAARARRLDPTEAWDFVCECGRCVEVIRLALAEYDERRASGRPLLLPGHAPDDS